ncbi:hypothetical protein DYB34_004772 [Aphanomyces astaci]|uniref:5-formyltetrahydrofolate cyclo-ligase n=1 Tax=Aphanomyces astaci TaxID=112090 RepID=A0A397EEL1_APHAT|nr:hypothetical protein DYB34_004772 [Aphanomyces astaci]RHY82014.1 hypothetical protein DYB31_004401 [Aphanomyces astaci]
MDGVKALKQMIRKDIDLKLRKYSADEVASASAQLTSHLVQHPAFVQAKSVCAYLPMPNEASTAAIIHEIFAQGKKLYVPKVTGPRSEDMVMLHVTSQRDIDTFPKVPRHTRPSSTNST